MRAIKEIILIICCFLMLLILASITSTDTISEQELDNQVLDQMIIDARKDHIETQRLLRVKQAEMEELLFKGVKHEQK